MFKEFVFIFSKVLSKTKLSNVINGILLNPMKGGVNELTIFNVTTRLI